MPLVESYALPVFGGEENSLPRQKVTQADLILNADLTNGILEARKGWRVVQNPDSWTTQADEDMVDRLVPDTYKTLAWDTAEPMGSFLFSAPSGSEYVINIYRYRGGAFGPEPYLFCRVDTTAGSQAHTAVVAFPISGQGTAKWLEGDVVGDPYVFSVFGARVYFTNGGRLWRWSEFDTVIRDASDEDGGFYRNPYDENQHIYLSEMKGASLIAGHNSRMVYAGFDGDTWLLCDKVIDPTSDEVAGTKDATKEGLKISADGQSVRLAEVHVFVSDPDLPRCVRVSSVVTLPNLRSVVAIKSYRQSLVIWSDVDMYLISTAGSVWSGRRYCGIGCASQRTVVETADGRLMWLARSGVYTWDGSSLPVLASAPVNAAFQTGEGHTGLPRGWTIAGEDTQVPHTVKHGMLRYASAAEIAPSGLYCVALKAGNAVEVNDVILCIQYTTGSVWWWTASTIKDTGVEDTPVDTVQSAMAGFFTLMSSAREPEKLFAQCYHYTNAATEPVPYLLKTRMCIAVMDNNSTDESLDFSGGDPVITAQPFEMLYVSKRFQMEDSSGKIYREAAVRMYATRDDTFNGRIDGAAEDTNKIQFALLPELAPFEAVSQSGKPAATASQEFITTVNPWPREFASPTAGYFWQPDAGDNTIGKWQADGGAEESSTHLWMPDQPFNRQVQLRTPTTQFARIAIRKRVDDESGASVRIISIGMIGQRVEEP